MKQKLQNPLLYLGVLGMLTIGTAFGVQLLNIFNADPSVWWTNADMKLPLEKAKNSFEIYLAGKQLEKHLSDGTLLSTDDGGAQFRVLSEDVKVRLNNWQEEKSSLLAYALISAFLTGMSLAFMLAGLYQISSGRSINNP